jgi:hypothetical protein
VVDVHGGRGRPPVVVRMAIAGRIVTATYRYKRPPTKWKAAALGVPAVVTTRSVGNRQMPPPVDDEPEPAAPSPANDDNAVIVSTATPKR